MLERNLQLAEPTVATPTTFKKFQNKLDTPLFIDAMLTLREQVCRATLKTMLTNREHGTRARSLNVSWFPLSPGGSCGKSRSRHARLSSAGLRPALAGAFRRLRRSLALRI